MKRLRIGILGTGGIARGHAGHLRAAPAVDIVAACGREAASAAAFVTEHAPGARVARDIDELLAEGVDALYVCLPPHAHDGQAERAAARGVHLFLEKPLALSAERAGGIAAVAQRAGVVTQVGFHVRHSPVGRRLRALIASGEAGGPTLLTASYWCNALHPPWWRRKDGGGGQAFEQAIHAYDLARWLLGEVASVNGALATLAKGSEPTYQVDDTSAALVRFRSGALAAISASNNAIPGRWTLAWTLVCARLTVVSATPTQAEIVHTAEGGRVERIEGGVDPYAEETRDFLAAIRSGGRTVCPVADGLASQRLVEAVAESSTRGGASVAPAA